MSLIAGRTVGRSSTEVHSTKITLVMAAREAAQLLSTTVCQCYDASIIHRDVVLTSALGCNVAAAQVWPKHSLAETLV